MPCVKGRSIESMVFKKKMKKISKASKQAMEQTLENEGEVTRTEVTKKRLKPYYRIHAHRNPLSDVPDLEYPTSPDAMDWSKLFPKLYETYKSQDKPIPKVDMADVGCGYGGLLIALSTTFPDHLILGMEIRTRVVEYVQQLIEEHQTEKPSEYTNISVIETNAMKFMPNFFSKGQLQKLFFLFPDPHFKKSNHRRRIISPTLLSEYAYILAVGGKIYTVTDVKDLYDWEVQHLSEHPLFERVPDEENEKDPVVPLILTSTQESKKVERQKGDRYYAVFRRIENKVQP